MFRINVSVWALFLACVLPVAAQPQAACGERKPFTGGSDLLWLRQQFNRGYPACKQNHDLQGDRAQD